MPVSRPRAPHVGVGHVVVRRGQVEDNPRSDGIETMDVASIVDRILRRSHTKRQELASPNARSDKEPTPTITNTNMTYTGAPPTLITLSLTADESSKPVTGALADNNPMETVIVSLQPPPGPPTHDRNNGISQTTEHLLIAAGSIGATIVIVMIVFAVYTMRKRGISFRMVVKKRNEDPPRAPSRYDWENKQTFEDDYVSSSKSMRSSSFSSRPPTQPLARSNSFNQYELERNTSGDQDRANPYYPNNNATPQPNVLPNADQRRSASTRDNRPFDSNEPDLVYSEPPRPPPPTFKQFMSNRPSISQRSGLGGATASRFSWTNSQAPQTPHELYNDGASQPRGRDSYMTQASEVPRFRTIDSWVNQQSNRVDTERLKQQFRMTQSSTYSADDYGDSVPAMPPVPKAYAADTQERDQEAKHTRHESHATTTTAPIFKYHPGNEVRFSTRSTVPSEVLDMGRKNAAL